jgi:predicted transposase/invertase (TIGR01784 family)
MKFVDVKNDVAFHRVFGSANKTVTLISFLNAIMQLEGENRISWVKIENPYQFPLTTGGKISILDVNATDQMGRKFVVEMQVADKEGFAKRTQFYTAREYGTQIESGDEYPLLRPTHFVGILNFNFTKNSNYYSHHGTIDLETGEHLLKDVQYFFIELLKFRKTINDLVTLMDKWTYFIKNAENLEMMPSDIKDEGLQTAYAEADKHNWSPIELKAYIQAGVRDADMVQERVFAENVGKEKAEAKAKEEAEMKEVKLILGLHDNNVPIPVIAKSFDKTEEEIAKIIKTSQNKK